MGDDQLWQKPCSIDVICPQAVAVVASWWLLREIETAAVKVADVKVDESSLEVKLTLPVSNTHAQAKGVVRSHACACTGTAKGSSLLKCPLHTMVWHLESLRNFLGDQFSPELPLFPRADGTVVCRTDMVAVVDRAAGNFGLDLVDDGSAWSQKFLGPFLESHWSSLSRFLASVAFDLLTVERYVGDAAAGASGLVASVVPNRLATIADRSLRSFAMTYGADLSDEIATLRSQVTALSSMASQPCGSQT
eukprot:5139032-Amphidinium_carterae.1